MKTTKMRILERTLIVFVFAALLVSLITSSSQSKNAHKTHLRALTEGWYYFRGEERIDVTLPCTIHIPDEKNLVLYYHDLSREDGSKTISTRAGIYNLRIQMISRFLYDYDDTGFKRNEQMRGKLDCTAILPENPESKDLILTYENQGDGIFHVEPVYLGRSGEILSQMWYKDSFMVLSVFTMSIIGFVCAGASLYLKYLHIKENRLGSCALFLLLCSAWCLLDSSLIQQMLDLSPTICVVALYAFMCMPIPVIHFVRNTAEMKKYNALSILIFFYYANIIVQSLLHVFGKVEYIVMLPATHVLMAATCLLVTHLLYKEQHATGDKELLPVLQSIFILALSALAELFRYWGLKSSNYGSILEIGVLVFIIRLICAIMVTMASNVQFKAEALVYKRLSREDRLTGLANRRAYDEVFAELEQTAEKYENVALIFLDVNGLKVTNDRYGHRAGDELIIGAARCLEYIFSGTGTYYRIGGDEFAAIVTNPTITIEDFSKRLDEAVAIQNSNSRYSLSIAWGVSFLRDESGNVKRTSDWMFEADQEMYKKKKKMKEQMAQLTEDGR